MHGTFYCEVCKTLHTDDRKLRVWVRRYKTRKGRSIQRNALVCLKVAHDLRARGETVINRTRHYL